MHEDVAPTELPGPLMGRDEMVIELVGIGLRLNVVEQTLAKALGTEFGEGSRIWDEIARIEALILKSYGLKSDHIGDLLSHFWESGSTEIWGEDVPFENPPNIIIDTPEKLIAELKRTRTDYQSPLISLAEQVEGADPFDEDA